MKILKELIYDMISIFINYFVAYIPCWHIRKLFYLMFGMKIGKKSRINQRVYIYSPWKISIGESTIVNSFSLLDGRGGLSIGSNTSISMRCIIYTASHKTYSPSFEFYKKPTVIGDNCWICVNAVVLAGSVVEDYVIVAANSVLKGETVEKGIYCGNPAEYIKERKISSEEEYSLEIFEFFT